MSKPFSLTLNEGQQAGLNLLENWLSDPHAPKVFRLRGRAGTGKSALIGAFYDSVKTLNQVLNTFGLPPVELFITATTNQAAEELNKKVTEPKVTTIYTLLGLTIRESEGESELSRRKNTDIIDAIRDKTAFNEATPVVIIDEASYVSPDLAIYIDIAMNRLPDLRVIFVYDDKQILPVNYDSCYVDEICDESNSVLHELTQNERFLSHGDSAIAKAADSLCKVIGNDDLEIEEIIEGPDLEFITKQQALELSLCHLRGHEYMWNLDHFVYLAHTNNNVQDSNDCLYREIHGNRNYLEVNGIHLTVNSLVKNSVQNNLVNLRNNQKVTLLSATHEGPSCVTTYDVALREVYLRRQFDDQDTCAFVPVDWSQYRKEMKDAADERDWKKFYFLKDCVADLRLSYCSTVYKAQGRSCNYVVVDVDDILQKSASLDQAKRLIYVAITRARKKVYLMMD